MQPIALSSESVEHPVQAPPDELLLFLPYVDYELVISSTYPGTSAAVYAVGHAYG
jgi:hypothetical protein